MRISNYGINYNDYAANNEFLRETDTPFKNYQNNGKNNTNSTTNSKANGSSTKTKEYQALAKLLTATAKNTSDLRDVFGKLSATGKESLFEKAKESKDTKEVVSEVKNFLTQYNEMVSGMEKIGGTVNKAQQKELEQYFTDNKEALTAIGITQNKDGTLSIDEEVLKKADIESLENLFSTSASFASKITIKSIYVEANLMKSQQANDMLDDLNSYNNYTQKAQRMSQPHRFYLK